ncbi:MAG: radical SAM protein [Planctomycetaceae bacterium]|jgi:MoaA/NifB/PqqE/SkfB family radical SAM enzyme|nr:radical SAM protein [Planctomycetaceae bacterium]
MDASPQTCRSEMTFEQKLQVADYLKAVADTSNGVNCRVDISGGEPMMNVKDHILLIERLSQNLGQDKVGLSCSGAEIAKEVAEKLAVLVSDVEMTMDTAPDTQFHDFPFRPKNYHKTAGESAKLLKQYGVAVGLQTVLTRHHRNPDILENLFDYLYENRIDNWSILKFFPAGRGKLYPYLELTDDECVEN